MTPAEMERNAAAMLAAAKGKKVQCRYRADIVRGSSWRTARKPTWNFEMFNYREAPSEPTDEEVLEYMQHNEEASDVQHALAVLVDANRAASFFQTLKCTFPEEFVAAKQRLTVRMDE